MFGGSGRERGTVSGGREETCSTEPSSLRGTTRHALESQAQSVACQAVGGRQTRSWGRARRRRGRGGARGQGRARRTHLCCKRLRAPATRRLALFVGDWVVQMREQEAAVVVRWACVCRGVACGRVLCSSRRRRRARRAPIVATRKTLKHQRHRPSFAQRKHASPLPTARTDPLPLSIDHNLRRT